MAERVRSIIITGGASGIGLGIAEHFASSKENNHITLLDINPTSGSQALDSLRSNYPGASLCFEACDVSSWESQAEAFEKVARERGGVDVVFANAGITESGKFIRDAIEDGDGKPVKPALKTVDVNFLGVVYCMLILTLWPKPPVLTWKAVYLAVHYISKNASTSRNGTQSKGSIVCTSSNAGLYAFPIAPIYAATKAGVIGLVRGLAQGLAVESIQINALAPAVIETNIAPSKDLFKAMTLTPMVTATRAVDRFLNDASLSGKVAELHGEQVSFAEPPPYIDEDSRRNIEMFSTLGYA